MQANGPDPAGGAPTRHLGLDLGGTNLKWTVVVHAAGDWRVVDRGQVATRTGGPDAIVPQLAEVAGMAMARVTGPGAGPGPAVSTAGIGVPGLYDPRTGATRFLVNIPGPWNGYPVTAPVGSKLASNVSM